MLTIQEPIKTAFNHPLNRYQDKWNYFKYTIPLAYEGHYSEVAYIPGFTSFELEELLSQLKQIKSLDNLSDPNNGLAPQILFALSVIVLKMEKEVPSNIKELKKNQLAQVNELTKIKSSDKTYKIKIGRDAKEKELAALVNFLIKNPKVMIRLDGNQALSIADLNFYWDTLEQYKHQIDYFEEPFLNYNDYLQIKDIPIAHDEYHPQALKEQSPKILVIKPSFFGHYKDLIALKESPHRIILSHCYESEKMYPVLNYLATHWPHDSHGLN